MEDIDHTKEPANEPILRINLKDADIRTGHVADDRRSRIADRRKKSDDN
jgi:hypothetical protein